MSRAIDIGANLLDPMFQGVYRGKTKHVPDLSTVLTRAYSSGVSHIILTSGTLQEAKEAKALIPKLTATTEKESIPHIYTTVGVHPTRMDVFKTAGDELLNELLLEAKSGAADGTVVAIGECGLDFDRLEFCSKETQMEFFPKHFVLAEETKLPMFLHCRKAGQELYEILKENRLRFSGGVVHSFDGSFDEAEKFISLGLFIGINGCSLKTEENLSVVEKIPLEWILVETDAPWCDIRPTHASSKFLTSEKSVSVNPEKYDPSKNVFVKSRNEPCKISQVLEVIAGVKKLDLELVSETIYRNSVKLFFPKQLDEKKESS